MAESQADSELGSATPTDHHFLLPAVNSLGWQDVTELCREAASTLGPDEMIHDLDFSLFGAMSALELMDAKMDKAPPALEPLDSRIISGALPTNLDIDSRSKPSGTQRDLKAEDGGTPEGKDLPQGSLSPSERALAVLDGMAVCEMAWHEGGSLPETLYACLYLHPKAFSAVLQGLGWELLAPSSEGGFVNTPVNLKISEGRHEWKPVDRALTLSVIAQALATLRCCSIVRDVIILADIFEEEDFYPNTFGFRLTPPVEDESLVELLDLAEEAMREKMKLSKSRNDVGNATANSARFNTSCASADSRILAHLSSRKQLLHACLALRDAFTNKQRQRRLKALAKQRADRADQAPPTEGAASTIEIDATKGKDDRPNGSLTSVSEDVDGEVVAAAVGLAAMAIDRDPARTTAVSEPVPPDTRKSEGAEIAGTKSSDVNSPSTEDGANLALVIEGKKIDSDVGVNRVGSEGVGVSGGEKEDGHRGALHPLPLQLSPEQEQEQEQEQENDAVETSLDGIRRCGRHLCAAVEAFDSLLMMENAAAVDESGGVTPAKIRATDSAKGKTPEAVDAARNQSLEKEGTAAKLGGVGGGFAFEAEMNRHLLGSSPHHHVRFRSSRADGPRALRSLAREAGRASGVVGCRDLLDVRRYLLRFSQTPEEDTADTGKGSSHVIKTASLFARSVAAVCLYRQDLILGRYNVMWFVAEAMTDIGVPDAVVNSPAGMAFLERVGKPVYETLRVLCLNRARQRSSLEVQMQDWRTLQGYADTVDDSFQLQYGLASSTQRYMAKWALSEVLGLMHRYLQMGVELQLPAKHEWPATYWYWDYVMTTKLITESNLREAKEQLEAIKTQMEEERTMAREAQESTEAAEALTAASTSAGNTTGKKGSKKKKRGGKNSSHQSNSSSSSSKTKSDTETPGVGARGREVEDASSAAKSVGGVAPIEALQKTEREISWAARMDWESADMRLRQCLCRGMVRLLAGLESLGLMGQKAGEGPDFRFTTPEIIHRERFRAFQALEAPSFQTHEAFLSAVEFGDGVAVSVVEVAAECFRTTRTLASEQLRRGELLAKAEAEAAAAATREAAAEARAGEENARETRPPAILLDEFGGGWTTEKSELLTLAKLAVSNGIVATQVSKRSMAVKRPPGDKRGGEERAKLKFGGHGQFPTVTVTCE